MIITLMLCIFVGIAVGLLGAGGSILTVPIFVYIGNMSAQDAISMSLFVVSITSLMGSLRYILRQWVNVQLALIFIVFGSIAAFFGARLSFLVSEKTLLLLFSILMLFIGFLLFFKDGDEIETDFECKPRIMPAALASTVLGVLTGFLGVGGGFLIVPTLAIIMRCSMKSAVGTSLIIIFVNALSGFAGHLWIRTIDWNTAITYAIGTTFGALIGSLFAGRLPDRLLRKIFSGLVVLTGIFVLFQNIQGS